MSENLLLVQVVAAIPTQSFEDLPLAYTPATILLEPEIAICGGEM